MTTLVYGWHCLECPMKGEGDGSDLAARKHLETAKHATTSWSKPAPKETRT